MKIRFVAEDPTRSKLDWLVSGLFEKSPEAPSWLKKVSGGEVLERLIESKDLSGSAGEITPMFGELGLEAAAALIAGLGPRGAFGTGPAFDFGVQISKRLGSKPRGSVGVVLPDEGVPSEIASAIIQGVIVGSVGPGLAKAEPGRHAFEELRLIVPPGSTADPELLKPSIARGEIIGQAINLARELVNLPPAQKTPRLLANRVLAEAEAAGLRVEVWDEARIRQERFGGLLGVAAGSSEPPVFVVLDWSAGGDSEAHLALVGKGVTFDSGGLSLKPTSSMEDMKADMSGAAIVASALTAIARLNLPVNVRGYLALTENMTGGRAMKLGDVLTMRNGKTVEIMNTDAEGRLILADALSFAQEQGPSRIIDLATLTGACLVALGQKVAGLFSNDDETAEAVDSAAEAVGERLWRLPLDDDYKEALKSPVADLKNVGSKWGGAITAAKFLEEFTGDSPWAHLDIAGPAWAENDSPTRDPGGTGCFVRTLVRLAEDQVEH